MLPGAWILLTGTDRLNMIKFSFFPVMLLASVPLCAQVAIATISQEFSTMENKMNLQYVLNEVDGMVYLQGVCTGESGAGRIQQVFPFDLATGAVTEKIPLFPPGQLAVKGSEPHELHACYPLNTDGDVQVIYSELVPKEKKYVTWAAVYHPSAGWSNKKKLHSAEDEPISGSAGVKQFFFASDSSCAVLFFYPNKSRKDKKTKELEIVFLDKNLAPVFSRKLDIPQKGKYLQNSDVRLTKDKILYVKAKIADNDYSGVNYYSFMLDMNAENSVPDESAYRWWNDMSEDAYIQAYTRSGAIYIKATDKTTGKEEPEKEVVFPAVVTEIIARLNPNKNEGLYVYELLNAGGGYTYTICGTELRNSKSTANGWYYEYTAREIVVGLLNPDGEFEWIKIIPRSLFAKTKEQMVRPYATVYGNHLYLVYNDNPANVDVSDHTKQEEARFDKSAVIVAKLDEEGAVQRSVVASATDIKADFEPLSMIRSSAAPNHLYGLARPMPRALHGLKIVQITLQ